jgi:hypothetical protein
MVSASTEFANQVSGKNYKILTVLLQRKNNRDN